MYEEKVIQSLVNLIETRAISKNKKIVSKAYLNLGIFNSYSADLIVTKFDEVKNTSEFLKNTELKINIIPAKVKCSKCEEISVLEENSSIDDLKCPNCNSVVGLDILEGEEFELEKIE